MIGFQVMPRLSTEDYEALEQDILYNGVNDPIKVSRDGRIIDGHHRDEIARKYDLHCPRLTIDGSEAELRGMAFRLNVYRRHLTREQKRELIAESLKVDPQLSNVEHARRSGVTDKTVASVRGVLEESSEIPSFSERIDPRTGNASQPASRSRHEYVDPETGELTGGPVEQLPAPSAPSPAKPKRRPLWEQVEDAEVALGEALDKLIRLTKDDRFEQNRESLRDRIKVNTPQLWDQKIQRICDAYGLNRLAEMKEATHSG